MHQASRDEDMRFSGWLFDRAEAWRQEAFAYRKRHGGNLTTLDTVASELEHDLEAFLTRTVNRQDIAAITGYSDRQVARWIDDRKVTLNENGEALLLDLPLKAGQLPKLLGLGPARKSSQRGPIELDEERDKRSRPWIKTPDLPATGS